MKLQTSVVQLTNQSTFSTTPLFKHFLPPLVFQTGIFWHAVTKITTMLSVSLRAAAINNTGDAAFVSKEKRGDGRVSAEETQ